MNPRDSAQKRIGYRPDINGLRAIAVLAVALFHFKVPGFSGGFVGVDVFFVVSGYLMTSTITSQLSRGAFSFAGFYRSRIMRIYPPMLGVIGLALALGYAFLDPTEYRALAKHALASALSLANIQFYSETGYFTPAADATWLLHLWSLSVEMQFYLGLPVLLWWSMQRNAASRRLVIALAACTALSFAACVTISARDQSAAFYLMPTRTWEFLAGALVYALRGSSQTVRFSAWLVWVGIVLVLMSIVCLNSEVGFSSIWALLPVFGAAIVVGFPSNNWCLTNPVSQFLGTISYSLYLWHWPAWVAARHYGVEPSLAHAAECLLASTMLGTASYYLIERPTSRLRNVGMSLPADLALAGTAIACATMAAVIILLNGFPDRAPELVRNVVERYRADLALIRRPQEGSCFLAPSASPELFAPRCFAPRSPSGSDAVMIWGDSYAAHLWQGAADGPEFRSVKLLEATAASCPPLRFPPILLNSACREVSDRVLSELANTRGIVILFARWQYYDKHGTDVAVGLRDTLAELEKQGHHVVIIGPNPEWIPTLPQRLFQETFSRGGLVPQRLKDTTQDDDLVLDTRLAGIAREMGAGYVSLFGLWCDPVGCLTRMTYRGREELLDYDYGHMTVPAAQWVARQVWTAENDETRVAPSFSSD